VSLSQNGTGAKPAIEESSANTGPTAHARTAAVSTISVTTLSGLELFDEQSFTKMLCLERKRTERSGRRFVLVLVDVTTVLRSGGKQSLFNRFANALGESTRETDIKGWYKADSVFGLIFTEIGDGDGAAITTVLLTKVTKALYGTLSVNDANNIRVTCHVYPEDVSRSGDGGPVDFALYPDHTAIDHRQRASRFLKRVIDIAGSLLALIVLSPLLLAIAIAIKMTSQGPVLFRQKRAGRYGAVFTFLKFRSMYLANDDSIHKEYVTRFISGQPDGEADRSAESVFKIKHDPRVTGIGRLLRRSSLDELPQLFNVLRGEMSLVGPRPPVLYEVACYEVWHKRRLLTVKPGITGLWQVGGRSRVKFNDMVRLDLRYAATWSVWLDIKILLRTPAAVVSGEGAY
jgi:lipopolysaccharide/colanic/teichoic acid biosynthesis glycosyltransferase